MSLTHTQVTGAKPKEKIYRLRDGQGLFLEVHPGGRKYWRHRFMINGKETTSSFGTFPEVSISDAREKLLEARKQVRVGINPNQQKRVERAKVQAAQTNTFKAVTVE